MQIDVGQRSVNRIVHKGTFASTPSLLLAMDFLKSAIASTISKDPPFPYKFGDKLNVDQSIWTLYNGTKRVCVVQEGEVNSS